jgi:hypothetical protein
MWRSASERFGLRSMCECRPIFSDTRLRTKALLSRHTHSNAISANFTLGNQRGPDPCGNSAMKAALEVDLDLGPYVFPAKFHWLKSRFQTFATKLAETSVDRSSRLP